MIAAAPIVAAATAIAGVPVKVDCRPSRMMVDQDLGYVYIRGGIPDHTIYLDSAICRSLSNPLKGFDVLDFLIVTHEAEHIALASRNECVVEQAAVANVWQTIRRFNLPAYLVRWTLANVAAANARLPQQYQVDTATGACPA